MGEEIPSTCTIAAVVEPRPKDEVGSDAQKCDDHHPRKEAPVTAVVRVAVVAAVFAAFAGVLCIPGQSQNIRILLLVDAVALPDESGALLLKPVFSLSQRNSMTASCGRRCLIGPLMGCFPP